MTLQRFALRNLSLLIFLMSYFALTVAGNIIYRLPGGEIIGQVAVADFSLAAFKTADSAEFFILLLLPFVVAPFVALIVRRLAEGRLAEAAKFLPEFRPVDYTVISVALYGYVIGELVEADAVGLIGHGSDVFDAVRSRYELLDRLGFWPQLCLKSLLLFLACYAFVRAIRTANRFWIAAASITFLAMTALLVLLNMKWPVLVYYAALTMATFCLSPRRPLLYGTACLIGTIVCYAVISSALLRLAPPPTIVKHGPMASADASATVKRLGESAAFLGRSASAAISSSAFLAFTLLNRMAQPFPYYVETFREGNNFCGTLVDRIERKTNPCQPSNVIYDKMFGRNLFGEIAVGRGTAPQAVHVYGYALQGWAGAIVELVLASIVIGLFMSVPVSNAMTGTIAIMGGTVGYFFSQLPFEGPVMYDHGILWWSALIVSYAVFRASTRRLQEVSHA